MRVTIADLPPYRTAPAQARTDLANRFGQVGLKSLQQMAFL